MHAHMHTLVVAAAMHGGGAPEVIHGLSAIIRPLSGRHPAAAADAGSGWGAAAVARGQQATALAHATFRELDLPGSDCMMHT